jgi:mannosyl-oligosaccharide alpha-1,2-mannosidase
MVSHASSDDSEFCLLTPGELVNMARMRFLALGAAILPSALALPPHVPENLASNVEGKRQFSAPIDRAQAVVDTFKISWEGYYKYAFPNDELLPVNNSFSNSR